ncbi:MAG: hypothetical protein AABX84_02380 [Nanoarchaeota archaeon]
MGFYTEKEVREMEKRVERSYQLFEQGRISELSARELEVQLLRRESANIIKDRLDSN